MNKTDMINALAEKASIKKKDADAIFSAVVEIIEDTLAAGDKVQIVGFGTFEVRNRAAKVGRNPQTNAKITIPASKHPVFTAGKVLKTKVNK